MRLCRNPVLRLVRSAAGAGGTLEDPLTTIKIPTGYSPLFPPRVTSPDPWRVKRRPMAWQVFHPFLRGNQAAPPRLAGPILTPWQLLRTWWHRDTCALSLAVHHLPADVSQMSHPRRILAY
jgi:hypothetical protein